MHDNTYIWTNDSRKLLNTIVNGIIENQNKEESIKEWSVLLYLDEDQKSKLPPRALLVNRINGEDQRTCLTLHAYRKTGADKNKQVIVVTPHFWTTYVKNQTSSFNELEALLTRFDKFVQNYFAAFMFDLEIR